MRGFSAPTSTPSQFLKLIYDATIWAPICFTAPAAQSVMRYYELRTKLALEGKTPGQIADRIQEAYVRGERPRRNASHIRVHVVSTPASRTGNRSLASAYDGVRSVLRELDGWRQRVWQSTSASERRCRNAIQPSSRSLWTTNWLSEPNTMKAARRDEGRCTPQEIRPNENVTSSGRQITRPISVLAKSSPLNRSGSPGVLASA